MEGELVTPAQGIFLILDVSIGYFFDDMSDEVMKASPRRVSLGTRQSGDHYLRDSMARRETLELVRTYYSIKMPKVRKRIYMVKAIATTINGD